jgi:glycosyltransferase involved in cell wall biosynthesis
MTRVLEVFEPPDGGVAQAVLQLATGLRVHGMQAEVAGPPDAIPYAALEAQGTRVHRLPLDRSYANPARDARALGALVRILRSSRFDLVHCHAAKGGALGRAAARLAGVPAIYSPHCLPFVGDVSARRRTVSLALERLLGQLTAAMVCVCEDERRLAVGRRLVPPADARVVLNGCEPCTAPPAPDERLLALRGDGVLAAAVSVLREQKGLHDLIAAAPRVLEALPAARIAIVGDGPKRPALEAHAAALGLDRHERFALLAYEGPAERHLRALDVYVLPSLWEALPIGALEAMACGVPQLATAVGGTPEAVTPRTGVLVAPHDPGALADALVALLGDPARRRELAAASPAVHAERFTVRRMVAETAAVYADVVSAAASTAGARPASA